MITLAMQAARKREPTQNELYDLIDRIREKRSLRAHYRTVLEFIRQNYDRYPGYYTGYSESR